MEKKVSKYRYERKFYIDKVDKLNLINYLKTHPSFFREIFCERKVNNIYFDTLNFNSFFENIDGIAKRKKYRIRWYGQTFFKSFNPKLELKNKQGLVGYKDSYKLKPMIIDENTDFNYIKSIIKKSKIPRFLYHYYPKFINSYKRRYFQSFDKNFRVTIDYDLRFYKLNKFNNYFKNCKTFYNPVIVEIKYNNLLDNNINRITSLFKFRLTKSSKFVTGINLFYN
jgi:hypothetical protein